jgi:hypothetical protein
MRRSWIGLLLLVALLHGAPAIGQDYRAADEARVLSMVNSTRASRGLPPLELVDELVTLARQQSVRMVEQNNLFHNPNLKSDLDAIGLDWAWSGENVGIGPDVDAVEQAFLNSQHHLENIVRSNYNSIGVGVVGTATGYVYVTQVFAELRGASAAAPPPATPAPATPAPEAPTPAPVAKVAPPAPAPIPALPDPVVIEGGVVTPAAPLQDRP